MKINAVKGGPDLRKIGDRTVKCPSATSRSLIYFSISQTRCGRPNCVYRPFIRSIVYFFILPTILMAVSECIMGTDPALRQVAARHLYFTTVMLLIITCVLPGLDCFEKNSSKLRQV